MIEAFEMSVLLVLILFLAPVIGIFFSFTMFLFLLGMPLWLIIDLFLRKYKE